MAEFNFPEWRLGPEPPAADLPPPEYAEADALREQQLNDQYLAGQRQILNLGEGAYYRQQGEAAIHAAPPALGALQQLKDDTLAQAGNDRQREALTKRLDWHHGEAARGISRHLSGQADAWRQAVADNQVKTAEEEAAVNHSDPTKVELFAAGAYTTRLRSAGQPPNSEAAQASAAQARSSVYRRAIEAALAAGDTRAAIGLYERAKDRLTADDAGPMQGQIKAVTQRETAQTYLAGLPEPTPGQPSAVFDGPKQLADADAAYRAATVRNQADWAHDDSQRAINQHYIDVQFGQQKQAIAEAKAKLDNAVSTWIATPRPDGRPQTDLPPPALWVQLSPDEQQTVLAALKRNATGEPAPDQARSFGIDAEASMKAARALRGEGDDENATSAGRQGAVHATEPSPDSVEYRAADAEARQLEAQERVLTDRMISQWLSQARSGDQLPPELAEQLGSEEKRDIEALASGVSDTKTDPMVFAKISAGLKSRDPAEEREWAQVPLHQYRRQLSAEDFAKLVELQRQRDPASGIPLAELAAIRQQLKAADTSDLAPLYKALEPDPHSIYGAWPWAMDHKGVRPAMPQWARDFLKGTLDLLVGTKTGELTPDAINSFTTIAGGAGRLFGPRGGAETLAAGGKRRVEQVTKSPRGGHHWVPVSIWDLPDLSAEARKVFNSAVSGPYGEPHLWSKPHAEYNQAVQELWDRNRYNPSKMTRRDAEDFREQVMRSQDPRIAPFRDAINDKRLRYERFRRGDEQ